jgi:hypothetical protein
MTDQTPVPSDLPSHLPPPEKAAEQAPARRVLAAGTDVAQVMPDTGMVVSVQPTQVRRPWRSTVRTTFQALVALAVLFPILVETAGLDPESFPWLAGALAVAATVARVMALPQVENFLRRFVPWLAAAPKF